MKLETRDQRPSIDIRKRISTSYGVTMTIMQYLKDIESIKLQQLSRWWYRVNTSRILRKFKIAEEQHYNTVYYILGSANSKNLASFKYNPKTTALRRLDSKDVAASLVSGFSWLQTPSNRIFISGGSPDPKALFELIETKGGVLKRINCSSMRYKRSGHSSCCLGSERVMITGSMMPKSTAAKCESYCIRRDSCTDLPDMQIGRYYHSSCCFN